MRYKTYKKEQDYSYVLGAFPTIELIETKPELIREVLISEKYSKMHSLVSILNTKGIKYDINSKLLSRISNRDDNLVAAVFEKKISSVKDFNHLMLVDPGDMGNLGTMIRTMVAFGFHDLAIIGEPCDYYNPRVIRASMGAIFKIRLSVFQEISSYVKAYPNRELFPFMLDRRATHLEEVAIPERYSLIFGNEGSGLPESYSEIGTPIIIPQSAEVDSLNLTIAAGIAMYHFRMTLEG